MNTVILMGRMTADPELKRTQTGKDVMSFSVAVDRGYGEKKQTDFINCVAWENTARFIGQWFPKGRLIALEGSLQTRSYEDKYGNKRTTTEVLVRQVHFTGDKVGSSRSVDVYAGDDIAPPAATYYPPSPAPSPAPAYEQTGFSDVEDGEGDLPW